MQAKITVEMPVATSRHDVWVVSTAVELSELAGNSARGEVKLQGVLLISHYGLSRKSKTPAHEVSTKLGMESSLPSVSNRQNNTDLTIENACGHGPVCRLLGLPGPHDPSRSLFIHPCLRFKAPSEVVCVVGTKFRSVCTGLLAAIALELQPRASVTRSEKYSQERLSAEGVALTAETK